MITLDAPAQIVLVEDDPTVNNLLQGFLRRRAKVTSFHDTETAFHTLSSSHERTIFIIDYSFRGISALALRKKLEPLFPRAKYLLTCRITTVKLAVVVGFDAILAKPYRLPDLIQKIHDIDRHWPD